MITAEQREARKRYCGSSDAAAVVGIDPRRSAADVWLQKTGRADDFAGNDATAAGSALERVVLDWAAGQLPAAFVRDESVVHEDGLLAVNFDGRVPPWQPTEKFVVEAKTTGIVGPPDPGFGEPGTDQVPERVVVQCHHQLFVAGPEYRVAWVPVLVGGRGFALYRVDRNDELAEALAARCRAFMTDFVRADVRPDDFRPSMDVIRRVRREPGETVELAPDLVDAWQAAKDVEKVAGEKKREAEAALLAALGTAERGTFPGGELTYYETKRKGYVVEPTAYRTLRVRRAKGT